MELSKLATRPLHDKGSEMQVVGPDGKKTDLYITLAGIDSSLWAQVQRKSDRAVLSGGKYSVTDAMAHVTLSWRGLTDNKKAVEFTLDEAVKLYDSAPYICKQADLFIAQRSNFAKPSRKK